MKFTIEVNKSELFELRSLVEEAKLKWQHNIRDAEDEEFNSKTVETMILTACRKQVDNYAGILAKLDKAGE
jgi:hypothetical protein